MSSDGKFGDLLTRLISAAVMILIAGFALYHSSIAFSLLLAICSGLMAWETLSMHGAKRGTREVASFAFAVSTLTLIFMMSPIAIFSALVLIGLCTALVKSSRVTVALFLVAIGIATVSLAQMRMVSMIPVLFLIACVIASDVGGYFAGRIIGGPKLWPAVSPKKTWSGTIGGWILAALVALIFYVNVGGSAGMFIYAVLISMAAQAGDLVESWIKRRAGIKDASNLIPGHGGLLDRFDGVIGAAILAGVISAMPV